MRNLDEKRAIVLLSGGQDSATCLSIAMKTFIEVHTVSFYYGQRHKLELEKAKKLSEIAGAKSHAVVDIAGLFSQVTESSLMDSNSDISEKCKFDDSVPASFVPFRNLFFISSAAAIAYRKGIANLMTGVCSTDFSGYFDCRDVFIKAANVAISLAGDCNLDIHTPLMWLTKAETVLLMARLETFEWYEHTLTCYEGKEPPCGVCPACKLRAKGFEEAGLMDPLILKFEE